MIEHDLMIEAATPKSVAPYGVFVGAHAGLPLFAQWPGATVYGQVPIDVGTGGELLHVVLQAREMPAAVELLERHFLHTQTYLPTNGKPFIMVMGDKTQGGLPDVRALRAFLFRNGAGIALHKGIWHEFPLALEDDTRFTVILREEAHINQLDRPEQPLDARGPDLERYDMARRARVMVFA